MRATLIIFFLFATGFGAVAQAPGNDDYTGAEPIINVENYCSGDAGFTSIAATSSGIPAGRFWTNEGRDVWFKFTSIGSTVTVRVEGKSSSTSTNTLVTPLIAIYSIENNNLVEITRSMSAAINNITSASREGLETNKTYYVRVSAEGNATGSFNICLNNFIPPDKSGQDCVSATVLTSKFGVNRTNVSGIGDFQELRGSCFNTESNSTWLKWTAAKAGTLTYVIVPTNTNDDMDWVLYDLGLNGDCSNLLPENIIRCAAASGVTCTPKFYETGLDMTSTDLFEAPGCVPGQDGFSRYLDMEEGHVYALIINNFTASGHDFNISFDGTGEFGLPEPQILVVENNPCTPAQTFNFSTDARDFTSVDWDFGVGASPATATGAGGATVSYATKGSKTVVLKVIRPLETKFVSADIYVGEKPAAPAIMASKLVFCLPDTVVLTASPVADGIYSWTGPGNFKSTDRVVRIPLNNVNQAGVYAVTVKLGNCVSDPAMVTIPPIALAPKASFTVDPPFVTKFAPPVTFQFLNQSANAVSYLWEFGDGTTSVEKDPSHTYLQAGKYTITLTVMNADSCENSAAVSNLVILDPAALLIPNSFSPNGDGVNDEFVINLVNLRTFNISIFNRYGEKVYNNNDIFFSWKGTYKDNQVPTGVYYYTITGTDIKGLQVKYNGSITIIR